ncbi:disease resistance RPP13-like protein 4 [Quercus lobata]|uniref:disease resistance RPP13-like protein 4 n=1 Tax=Quercus lobata TaxID=97700 RepID=UPI001245D8B8|nr:disease resistance RPP13-like protein 4 [Quercus lobata]
MFSSNETQNSPGETSTLPKGEPTVSQTTVETTTTNNSNSATITTNPDNNGNNNGGGGKDRISIHFNHLKKLLEQMKSYLTVLKTPSENAVVKRRIFVYWGLGEEELRDAEAKSPEKIVDKILEEFQEKGLIEPVIKKRKQPQHVKSYRMDPLVRSAATLLPKEAKFFDYDGKGNVLPQRDWTSGLDSKGNPVVDENVSWPRSQRLCPESLSFLSLQGISRIKELPRSIGLLRSLLILDLKECHNLEILSEEIANLTNLRYLDVSDCYLLADMPKGLGVHSELRVLKGFVISNRQKIRRSGTLHDLKRLRNLRKLTINARSKDFPTRNDLSALQELGGVLRNLTIVWGPTEPNKAPKPEAKIVEETKSAGTVPIVEIETLPRQLKKLDLQCFPKSTATWLTPESLPNLEKLYVRGNLATLGESKWSQVKTLRLKYLNELKTTWIKLQQSFPKLEYLEKVKCPGIILCPCDEHGVWMKTI